MQNLMGAKRARDNTYYSSGQEYPSFHATESFGPSEVTPEEIEFDAKDVIGSGSFGTVYRGRCRQKPVAIKVLRGIIDEKKLSEFRTEVHNMSKIFHPNICLFMGAALAPGECIIVTELLPKGNVEMLLHNKEQVMSLSLRMRMARDAAFGMNWLHCSNPIFIHRDLKSSNLLVDNHMNVKVCDFGLSQFILRDQMTKDEKRAKGTPLWMAPEVMNFQAFNEKCDVYSFGIVLWELLTRKEPFEGKFKQIAKFKEAVCLRGERPILPTDSPQALTDLINLCWHQEPTYRPTFEFIINSLHGIIVDCSIRDAQGRIFWKTHYLKEEEVPWNDFVEALCKYVGMRDDGNRETNQKCLKAILVEPKKETVSIEAFGKVLDWFAMAHGVTSVEADTVLDRIRELLTRSWFHGDITTAEAEQKLVGLPHGAFLVRFSSTNAGNYTISSVAKNGTPRHQRVSSVPGQGYNLNGLVRPSLPQIVNDCDGLYIPCPGSKYQSLFASPIQGSGYEQCSTMNDETNLMDQ
ncbi:SH2 domain-containing protein [Planoprotostelium fungivorum]|uniref:non-specific serine/threonine protein kinase n=1 Tax=Planoprotostelium fungivorum TaxID=1890364 RepID=A0A2P6NIL7_9EUKA|nr:SH2 domain-containing protein [Planoprotostelium fungivorum]